MLNGTNWLDDLGDVLRKLREASGSKQAEIAVKMNVDQSRISRFETGDVRPTPDEVAAFLKAVGTPEAEQYGDYLNQGWSHLPRPQFGHPEIAALSRAESCLGELEELLSREPSNAVRAQADMHMEALRGAAGYLIRCEHKIAFIGEIGVGKSAAISVLFNLLLPASDNKPALERTLLPLGTGRVTICEEEIATEPGNFAIVIDPEPEEEVLRVVSDVCADAWKRTHDSADGTPSSRVTWEIERAVRNMSGLMKPRGKTTQSLRDPLDDLARSSGSRELLCTEVFSRLNLWRRTRIRLETPPHDGAALWLRDTLKEVNYGRIDDVGLPRRIKVIVPFVLLPNAPYTVTVIDTKGLEKDDYAVRPDLMERVDDDRTIIVLCSQFNSLPDIPSQQLLKHVLETRPERVDRCVLLGLAKFGEALNTPTDLGDPVEDKQEAYELKAEHARRELRKMNLDSTPVQFYDSISDDPTPVTGFLTQQITKRRAALCERISQIQAAAQQLIRRHEDIIVLKRQAEVRRRLLEYLDQHENLPAPLMPPYAELLETISRTHQRTVWASARRNGTWWGLDVYFHLGEGMLIDARRRCGPVSADLETLVTRMIADDSLAPVRDFLSELRRSCESWKAQFFDSVKLAGQAAFLPSLKEDHQVWKNCVGEYGKGLGFRNRVSAGLRAWFEKQETTALLELLEEKVHEAWKKSFVDNLKKLAASLAVEAEGRPTTVEVSGGS